MRKDHQRRHRRQAKQALAYGPTAKPRHRAPSGRTGQVHAKKTPSSAPAGLTRAYGWQRINGKLVLVPLES